MVVALPKSAIAEAFRNRPFQKDAALFAQYHRNVLIADEPGLGKTLESIAAVVGSNTSGSVLVVAPKTAMYVTWPAELQRWLSDVAPKDRVRLLGGKLSRSERLALMRWILIWDEAHYKRKTTFPIRQWVVVSPNYLRYKFQLDSQGNFEYDQNGDRIILPVNEALTALLAVQWQAVIVDEAHQTLAGATGNIKKQSSQSRGIRLLDVSDNGLRIALTGTPFRGKHENLWGILNWLEPGSYTSYWDWVKKHFDVYIDHAFGQEVIGNLKSEKALSKELRALMIRRTKKDVLPELPPKVYGGTPLPGARGKNVPVAVWLPMNGEQRKAYEQMKKEAMADLDGGTLMANSILAEMVRLKQFANSYGYLDSTDMFRPQLPSNKFDWITEFLSERGIDGSGPGDSKVVIASQFTKHINLFAAALREKGIDCFVLTGETSEAERVNMQRDFQSGTFFLDSTPAPDVFLLNTHAGGVSLTLDAADDIVLVDSTYSSDDQTQVEDRCHRISRMHMLTVWCLASKGTIDESILRETYKTGLSLRRILDRDRTIVKQLLDGTA
jgi:SNF2 family DNA or RNA helicase